VHFRIHIKRRFSSSSHKHLYIYFSRFTAKPQLGKISCANPLDFNNLKSNSATRTFDTFRRSPRRAPRLVHIRKSGGTLKGNTARTRSHRGVAREL
jgi:hypothetical protein